MTTMSSQITSLTIVYSTVYSGADQTKKTSKRRVTGLCAGNSPGTGEFPAQMASNAENVSIWWRLHVTSQTTPHTSPWQAPVWCEWFGENDHVIAWPPSTGSVYLEETTSLLVQHTAQQLTTKTANITDPPDLRGWFLPHRRSMIRQYLPWDFMSWWPCRNTQQSWHRCAAMKRLIGFRGVPVWINFVL